MRRSVMLGLALMILGGTLTVFVEPVWAVPAFARRYGVSCSTCHDAWPHLNSTGWSFKMSGYRRLNGRDLEPTQADIDIAMGALTIPSIPPLAITGSFGVDWRQDKRHGEDGTTTTRVGSSLDVESVEVFAATPLGKHLSFFAEFPMFETHALENDAPTGPAEANATSSRHNISFETESPTFEKGKMMWNSLLPASFQTDLLNIMVGLDQLPTAFSPEANRLSAAPYLIYRRHALDLISRTGPGDLFVSEGNAADRYNRLGEPQIQVALNGIVVFGDAITDLAKPAIPALEYHVGITNGSNNQADPNTEKDVFGRLALHWFGQVFGVFGYYSPDIYDDVQRSDGALSAVTFTLPDGTALTGTTFSGRPRANRFTSVGPDLLLSLQPWDIPVWLEAQALFNEEHDPTGFGKSFSWWGGFAQLYAQPIRNITAYARYDWLQATKTFDDTTVGGATGPVRPREWDIVVGAQWYVLENLKIGPEFMHRHYDGDKTAAGLGFVHRPEVNENFIGLRASVGF